MSKENDDNLSTNEDDVTIIDDGNNMAADVSASEDTAFDDYRKEIERQTDLVNKLVEQNKSLTEQINILIRNGANVNDGKPTITEPVDTGIAGKYKDEFIPLEDLGKMMYKKE